jgi:WD40 repeat protein
MGLSPNGDVAVLAGRRSIAAVAVDSVSVNPGEPLARAERGSKWDVSCVALSHSRTSQGHEAALGSNTTVELWHLDNRSVTCGARLKAHARAVTDVDWCPPESNGQFGRLATCSVDTYIFIWDTRTTGRDSRGVRAPQPAVTFSAMNAAYQVKWCPSKPNILASAHEGD